MDPSAIGRREPDLAGRAAKVLILMNSRIDITAVLAARNEEVALRIVISQLHHRFVELGVSYEIVVVDGDSSDGTAMVARSGGARLIRQRVPGYGAAIRLGLASSLGNWILVLDCDGSHPAELIPKLWHNRHNQDIVIASRMHRESRDMRGITRRTLTSLINGVFKYFYSGPVNDFTGSFRLYRRESIPLDLRAKHFDIQPEIAIICISRGMRICELPYTYTKRIAGVSNARILAFGCAYLLTLFRYRLRRL